MTLPAYRKTFDLFSSWTNADPARFHSPTKFIENAQPARLCPVHVLWLGCAIILLIIRVPRKTPFSGDGGVFAFFVQS